MSDELREALADRVRRIHVCLEQAMHDVTQVPPRAGDAAHAIREALQECGALDAVIAGPTATSNAPEVVR